MPMSDDFLLKFLEIFGKTPSNMLLILFAVFALKKWLINGSIRAFLELQTKKCALLEQILERLMQIDSKEDSTRKQLQDVLALIGSRRSDAAR